MTDDNDNLSNKNFESRPEENPTAVGNPLTSLSSQGAPKVDPNLKRLPDHLLKNRYNNNSPGPFIVLIQPSAINSETLRLNATRIGRIILSRFTKTQVNQIFSSGKHQCSIDLSNAQSANDLINDPAVKAANLVAFIPDSFLTCEGLIKGVPLDIDKEELISQIISPARVLDARRQNRKVTIDGETKLVPTQTFYLKFENRVRPDHVSLFQVRHPVDAWVSPVKIRFNCFRFNHVASQCKSRAKCMKCGDPKHTTGVDCPNKDGPPRCANCKEAHLPIDRKCRLFLFEKSVRATAALENIPPAEARKMLENLVPYPNMIINRSTSQFPPLRINSSQATPSPSLQHRASLYSQVASASTSRSQPPSQSRNQ